MPSANPPALAALAVIASIVTRNGGRGEDHAGRYGLRFGQPDWLPELIGRYHVTPPPGA